MPLSHIFISKSRKIDFELTILIQDLTNVPLVSGLYYVKWRLKNATHNNGSTVRAPIRDHCIFWGHPISTMAQLIISKQHVLGPCEFKLEVYQELGGSKDTIPIGSLTINLSEYASSGLTTRRYLLDDCKFNSTIKLSIKVDQRSDALMQFDIPPLKKQQIFTDIPSMITERKERSLLYDERSLHSASFTSNAINSTSNNLDTSFRSQTPVLKKSQSAISLPHYCRQVTPFNDSDDPSPVDLVEQLFKEKPTHA
ncbi:N-terminal C2 in EEIG1 and EHBP1 proteins-domain-containing protein [Helicostylum pulchrum]|nr:N-terminal C2 in EEIG1 and EHBP1 proteins-domain-containing protein [Helicostylum pulchrum]KAI9263982.1 N-terminal C2 in EEIG1 and EHBP1 proteins-domain-containing protein [Helicostylum pulchrum]